MVIQTMKLLSLILLFGLVACAGQRSLEELEQEALVTGDWSQVEKKERALSRSGLVPGSSCDAGLVLFCGQKGPDQVCECVPAYTTAGKVKGP